MYIFAGSPTVSKRKRPIVIIPKNASEKRSTTNGFHKETRSPSSRADDYHIRVSDASLASLSGVFEAAGKSSSLQFEHEGHAAESSAGELGRRMNTNGYSRSDMTGQSGRQTLGSAAADANPQTQQQAETVSPTWPAPYHASAPPSGPPGVSPPPRPQRVPSESLSPYAVPTRETTPPMLVPIPRVDSPVGLFRPPLQPVTRSFPVSDVFSHFPAQSHLLPGHFLARPYFPAGSALTGPYAPLGHYTSDLLHRLQRASNPSMTSLDRSADVTSRHSSSSHPSPAMMAHLVGAPDVTSFRHPISAHAHRQAHPFHRMIPPSRLAAQDHRPFPPPFPPVHSDIRTAQFPKRPRLSPPSSPFPQRRPAPAHRGSTASFATSNLSTSTLVTPSAATQQQQQQQQHPGHLQTDQHSPRIPPHFMRGSIIQLASGNMRRVEDLRTEDFVTSADVSEDLKIDCSQLVEIEAVPHRQSAMLTFHVGEQKLKVGTAHQPPPSPSDSSSRLQVTRCGLPTGEGLLYGYLFLVTLSNPF